MSGAYWFTIAGGDGFYTAQDPTNPDIAFGESQGGNIGRYRVSTGERTALVITLLLSRGTGTGLLERLCLAYPLGMGLLTVQIFLLALVRIPLTLGFAAVPVALEIAVLYAVMKRKNRTR